jgi:glycosyltransferase 2 family protein
LKFTFQLCLSLLIGAFLLWLCLPDAANRHQMWEAMGHLSLKVLLLYLLIMAGVHLFRVIRWNYLLRPLGMTLPFRKLFAISSVGFIAIIALPVRIGELVRPYLVAERGKISMSAALGTIAVERVVDGLLTSLFLFGSFLALRSHPGTPVWMMPVGYLALGVFVAATFFLLFAMRWPSGTVLWSLRLCGLTYLAPRLAAKIGEKLYEIIRGFRVLGDKTNLIPFVIESIIYWGLNGLGNYVLALGLGLPLSLVASFAVMGMTVIGIFLPNSPGQIGNFHYFTKLGLLLYLPASLVAGTGMAYVFLLHGIQLAWYAMLGIACCFDGSVAFIRTVKNSLAEEPLTWHQPEAVAQPQPLLEQVGE